MRPVSGFALGMMLVWVCALAACPGSGTGDGEGEKEGRGSGGASNGDGSDGGGGATQLANAPSSDAGEAASCEIERGDFEPVYIQRTGDCGPLDDANNVPLQGDIQIQKFANVDVETETVVNGCSVTFTQTVLDKAGVPQKQITGTLQADLPTKLTGEVTLQRFDTDGTPVCFGTYDAILIKNTTTLGGAAQ